MTRHQIVRVRVGSKTTVECDCGALFVSRTRAYAFENQIDHATKVLAVPSVFASLETARST